MIVDFTAPLWLWNGKGAWHFVTLPVDQSEIIKMAVPRRGWGSVRVKALIGETSWSTSIFPDSKSGAYVLPVKADVRKAEGLDPGDMIEVSVSVDI